MKLKEIYYQKTLKSYWMNGDTKKVIELPSNTIHSQFAIDNAQSFGLTPDEINQMRSLPLDDLRDEITKKLIDQGWIRIGASFGSDIEIQAEDPFDAAWALKQYINLEGDPENIEIEVQGTWYRLPSERLSHFLKYPANLSKFAGQIQ